MRTDVKIGAVLSLVVVVAAGWYYFRRSPEENVIPLGGDNVAEQAGDSTAEPSAPVDPVPLHTPDNTVAQAEDEPPAETYESDSDGDEGDPTLGGILSFGEQQDAEPAQDTPLATLLASGQDEQDDDAGPFDEDDASSIDDQDEAAPIESEQDAALTSRTTPLPPAGPVSKAANAGAAIDTGRPDPSGTKTHVVERGDTLSILAEVYYGSQRYVGTLIEANPGIDPNRLLVGTVLKVPPMDRRLPPTAPTAKRTAGAGEYLVQSGDSFYSIAEAELGDGNRWKELLELNTDLVKGDPQKLRPGQVLKLPAGN